MRGEDLKKYLELRYKNSHRRHALAFAAWGAFEIVQFVTEHIFYSIAPEIPVDAEIERLHLIKERASGITFIDYIAFPDAAPVRVYAGVSK